MGSGFEAKTHPDVGIAKKFDGASWACNWTGTYRRVFRVSTRVSLTSFDQQRRHGPYRYGGVFRGFAKPRWNRRERTPKYKSGAREKLPKVLNNVSLGGWQPSNQVTFWLEPEDTDARIQTRRRLIPKRSSPTIMVPSSNIACFMV